MQATDAMSPKPVLAWILGRGVAAALGFAWRVPGEDYAAYRRGKVSRADLEKRIRDTLSAEQAGRALDRERLERFFRALPPAREHRFATTNWNTLLDEAFAARGYELLHLNGSLAEGGASLRTELDRRPPPFPFDAGACVLAGLSLDSELDRALLAGATHVRDWYVVNPHARAVAPPGGRVHRIPLGFEGWVDAGLPGIEGSTTAAA